MFSFSVNQDSRLTVTSSSILLLLHESSRVVLTKSSSMGPQEVVLLKALGLGSVV